MSTNTTTSLDKEVIQLINALFPEGVVFFDLETTGLSPLCDKIIEFAVGSPLATPCVKVAAGT